MAVASNIDNEKIRLTATLLNTIAAALITVGLIVPFADILFRSGEAHLIGWSLLWLSGAGCLHWLARRRLERLMEE